MTQAGLGPAELSSTRSVGSGKALSPEAHEFGLAFPKDDLVVWETEGVDGGLRWGPWGRGRGADGRGSDGATAGPPGPWFISGKGPPSPTRAGLGQQNTGWIPALSHPLTTSLCAADNLHDLMCQPQKREAQGMVWGVWGVVRGWQS